MNKLPKFTLYLADGNEIKSSSFKSKTILFFYPKAMTSGCTLEVTEFQMNLAKFKNLGFTIIGCSKDSVERNIKFATKYKLKYLLGSDLKNASEKLGIWIEKSMYGRKYFGINRATFMIDSNGNIFNKWIKVKVKGHVKEVLEFAKNCP